jgi:DMSO/TMAO reductase YedYZ heme-binding membrane subunit
MPIIGAGFGIMEPLYTKVLRFIHPLAATHKQLIRNIFFVIELGLVVLLVLGSMQVFSNPPKLLSYLEVARTLGTVAAIFLALAVLPGILGRLRWFTLVRIVLMMFRRHFGIMMYLSGLTHGWFMFFVPTILFGPAPPDIFVFFGTLTILLGFPLFLTSNDWAVALLKNWWYRIHKLVYFMLLLAGLHTMYTSPKVGVLLLSLVALEIISFIAAKKYAHTSPRG